MLFELLRGFGVVDWSVVEDFPGGGGGDRVFVFGSGGLVADVWLCGSRLRVRHYFEFDGEQQSVVGVFDLCDPVLNVGFLGELLGVGDVG